MMLGRGYNGMYENHMLGNGFMFGGIFMVIVLILIIVAIVLLVKKYHKFNHSNNDVLEMLNTKFVNGEITEEEYKAKKRVLKL